MSRFGKLFRGAAAAASVALGANFAAALEEPVPLPPSLTEIPGLAPGSSIEQAGFGRARCGPGCAPSQPCQPCQPCQPGAAPSYLPTYPSPAYPMPPGMGDPTMPQPQPQPQAQPQPAASAPDFGDLAGGADVGPTVGLNGYIENAAPVTMARVRFDAAYGNNRPDRGNFFYAKCGCFQALGQRDALGPPLPEKNIDYQELISSGEFAFNRRMSAFFDVPVRFLNPDVNANAAGLGDIGFGGKYAFVYTTSRIVSLMLRFQAPAGSLSSGLGNGNWWIEPGLLYLEQLNRNWQLFGELRFLAPLGMRTDFVGNMLRYGLGTSYVVAQGRWGYVAPVVEAVGWTVLSGKELDPDLGMAVRARGDTIVNAKLGLRIGIGAPQLGSPYPTRSDLSIGYGRALTGEVWYKDMMRLEYRRFF
jgi:hypothetical protein